MRNKGEKYDLFSREFKANPFPTFARMRREDPIYPHRAPDGATIWYVTRYEDVTAVLKDNETFCKDPRHAQADTQPQKRQKSGLDQSINENMLFSDPPDHTRLRALVSQAFTPRRIEGMADRVQATADRLLDRVQADGEMDLMAAFALPLPVMVICDLLGVPESDREDVSDWSQAIISPGSRGLNYSARKRKVRALVNYMRRMFVERQARPQDDLVTALVQAEESGDRLNEAELSSMVALLLVTGHETTVNLIGNGMLALLEHPDQMALLRRNPAAAAAAVEELLRYDGPVETSTSRWVRRDVTWGGCRMRQGEMMRAVITSANRDEAVFERPSSLDITRQDNRHLAFGLGIHYCLGAPLARLEGRIAFNTLLRRLPGVRLERPSSTLSWRSGVLFRGLERLPLAWPV